MVAISFFNEEFKSKKAALDYIRTILNQYKEELQISGRKTYYINKNHPYFNFLNHIYMSSIEYKTYPELRESQTKAFIFGNHPIFGKCTYLEHIDINNKKTSLTWKSSVVSMKIDYPTLLKKAMRLEIYNQTREHLKQNNTCAHCKEDKNLEVDHYEIEFKDLYHLMLNKMDSTDLKFISCGKFDYKDKKSNLFADSWSNFHKENSKLMTLCYNCHLKKTHNKK